MSGTWDDRLDSRLLKAQASGLSFAEVGQRIGVTRSAAIGRYHRLKGTLFPSQADAARRNHERDIAGRAWKEARAMEALGLALSCGEDRNAAIRQALDAGCRTSTLAKHFGLTNGRIHQIVNK
jgi:hypothetical protein